MAKAPKGTYFDLRLGPSYDNKQLWYANAELLDQIINLQNTRDLEDSKKINELLKQVLAICKS